MNKIFVIEGTDGSGKKTQTKLIHQRLIEEGNTVSSFPFPNYNSLSSGPVRMYLEGELSQDPNEISQKAASTLYAVDRYITYKKEMEKIYKDDNTIILLDRYSSANLVHQGSKIIEKFGLDEKKLNDFINWDYNLEHFDLELPKADLTFFMNMPIKFVNELISNRADEITGNFKKDIHERNTKHLENSLISGLYAAKKLNWYIVDCVKDEKLRSIEDINDEIYSVIKKNLT